jgi:hypothetical protein
MILPRIEILRGGHGKYNLRSSNVLSCNIVELSFLWSPIVVSDKEVIPCSTVRTENHFM